MAPYEARERHPAAGPKSEAVYRLIGVFRTCRKVPAAGAEEGRDGEAIDRDQFPACLSRQVPDRRHPIF